ncbi:hypothetical protein C3B58_12605 [Lactonifactor longoviformis]|uniref:Uroporphyrinogen decarboxylase (URO-D) n=1 Tax=Lactonifactor longoviformis DSM 17459 TaxID=1122155 RepID=A0A1M4ZPW8_9CLOT|nr:MULTISPECIES: uroporphyrinogen decarboxylase family protein [Lactonifactor]MCB5714508.1 hypothetical protein [Lactonifactor longoviformis]MCB5718462.1 hypothetical protein [Lactonifactor longoviformis]MSA01648.1 hypothetical protein [Lactonifactor sp. BIOML-A5]MSA08646.1 hypothetical protein [Lactonifactor sp. BIOML-A4]MSA13958.1 hypothetical protein [Lactonifactor sp. BIOML-A3]
MTARENALEVLHWGKPEYVPLSTDAIQLVGMIPGDFDGPMKGGKDLFGVPWVESREGAMVASGFTLFDDICEWEKYIKRPDLSVYDFKRFAEMEYGMIDSSNKVRTLFCQNGLFMRLVNTMGFMEGLIAIASEPERCMDLFEYLTEYVIDYMGRAIDAYNPDMVTYFEDIATSSSLFISLDTYRKVLKPFHKRIVEYVHSRGLIFQMHTCGKCEDVLNDYVDIGVQAWHSAQISNNIEKILQDYKGRIVVEGGWDSQGEPSFITATEETVRAETRRCMDTYGRYPGFILCPVMFNERGNSVLVGDDRLAFIEDEWKKYRSNG